MYKIIPHKRVIKFINSRNLKERQRIRVKFNQLKNNPYPTNINLDNKKMTNQDKFRLRIGNYRFLYSVIDSDLVIYMEDGDNRGDIY